MSDLRSRFAEIFGGNCSVPEGGSRSAATEVQINGATFDKLVDYWRSLSPDRLPHLRGITVNRETNPRRVQLLIDSGVNLPIVLLSVDRSGRGNFPTLRGIWPYCAWWEMELATFDSFSLSGGTEEGGLAWRRG